MKYLIAALFVSTTALAQNAPDVNDLSADWQAMMIAQKHLGDDIRQIAQENKALKEQNEKLKTPPVEKKQPE